MSRAADWQHLVADRPRLLILPDTREEIGLTASVSISGDCEIVVTSPVGEHAVTIPKTYTLALAHFLQTTWGESTS